MKTFFKNYLGLAALLFVFAFGTACSAIDDDTTTVLVKYNDAISDYNEKIGNARMIFGQSNLSGLNMYQAYWNETLKEHKLDSLLNWFYEKHGEKEYNKLMLKVDDNFDRKMNK